MERTVNGHKIIARHDTNVSYTDASHLIFSDYTDTDE